MLGIGTGLGIGSGFGLAAAFGGYNPLTELGADLAGYFEAQQPDSITHVGGLVSEWRCRKTGYAVTQSVDGAKPVYSPTSFNGDAGLLFDGVDDVLAGVSHPFPLTNYEVWLLLSQITLPADTTQRYALGMGTGSGQGATVSRIVTTGVNRIRGTVGNGTAGVVSNNVAVDFSSRHVARMIVKATGVTMEIDDTTVAESAVVPSLTNARFRFAAFINTLAGNFYNGQIAACLITNLLSGSKLTALDNWLLARRRL